MSLPSPTCTVNSGATPASVSAGASFTIALADTTGANYWSVVASDTDDLNSAATVDATIVINSGNKTATCTAPAALGSAVRFVSTVGVRGLGLDANGIQNPALVTSFKVNVPLAGGLCVLTNNETYEQNTSAGWAAEINAAIRVAASGSGVISLRQDAITTDSIGTTKVVGFATVPIDTTTPYTNDVQAMSSTAAQYVLATIERVISVDWYIAKQVATAGGGYSAANQTAGWQAALNAAATLSQQPVNAGASGAVRVVAGTQIYSFSALVTVVNAQGLVLEGTGPLQTMLLPANGQPAAIRFTNCRQCVIRNIGGITVGQDYTTTGASAGSSTLPVSAGNTIANGAYITILNNGGYGATFGEVALVSSGGGTTSLTLSAPLRNTYANADMIRPQGLALVQFWSDIGQSGNSTQNTVEDCVTSNMTFSVSTGCVGGTGSSSDAQNDQMVLSRVKQIGSYNLAGFSIGHLNSLLHCLFETSFTAVYGVSCLTGGSFNAYGGTWFISGYALALGGTMSCTTNLFGTCVTDSIGSVIQARASDALAGSNARSVLNMVGCQFRTGTGGTDQKLFDVTGTNLIMSFYACGFSPGVAGTAYLLYFKDSSGNVALKSNFAFYNCQLGAYGGTADAALVITENSPWTAHGDGLLHETTLNGGIFAGESGGIVANGEEIAPYMFGQKYGYSVAPTQYPTSSNYTIDSRGVFDHTIIVNNSAGAITISIPAQLRSRRLFILALYAANVHTVTITPASGLINGASSLVLNSTSILGSAYIETDTSNWYQVGSSGGTSGVATGLNTSGAVTTGANNNLVITNEEMEYSGAGAAYSVTGFIVTGSVAPVKGQKLTTVFKDAQALTLTNASGSSTYPLALEGAANVTVSAPSAGGYISLRWYFDGTSWKQA